LNTVELLVSEAIQAEDFRIGPFGKPGLSAFTEKYLFSLTQIDSLPGFLVSIWQVEDIK